MQVLETVIPASVFPFATQPSITEPAAARIPLRVLACAWQPWRRLFAPVSNPWMVLLLDTTSVMLADAQALTPDSELPLTRQLAMTQWLPASMPFRLFCDTLHPTIWTASAPSIPAP